MLKKFRNQI